MANQTVKPKYLPPQIWIPVLTSAICLAVLFVLWGLDREAPNQASPSTSLGTTDQTVGWKTYRNEEFGLEVKYPGDWRIEYGDSNPTIVDIQMKDSGSQYLFSINKRGPNEPGLSYASSDSASLEFRAAPDFNDLVKKYLSSSEKEFLQYSFRGLIIDDGKGNEYIRAYKILPNGKVVIVSWSRTNCCGTNDFSIDKFLLPILSTFKFTK